MKESELKQARAAFKAWYTNRLCTGGTYRVLVTFCEQPSWIEGNGAPGVRYVVERDGMLHQVWKDGKDGYERIC